MAPLCSCTGLGAPVPKGNLGSLIRTKLEMPIKWMEVSRFSSSKESAPYKMCCKGDVQCSRLYDIDGVILHHAIPPRQEGCTFLQHYLLPVLRRKDKTWWYRTPSFFMTIQGDGAAVTYLLRCVSSNGRFWNIHRTHPIWVYAVTISSPKWKNRARDPLKQKIWTYPCYMVVTMELQRKWAHWWCTTPSIHLAKGDTLGWRLYSALFCKLLVKW